MERLISAAKTSYLHDRDNCNVCVTLSKLSLSRTSINVIRKKRFPAGKTKLVP